MVDGSLWLLQSSEMVNFRPETWQKSNHILRWCKKILNIVENGSSFLYIVCTYKRFQILRVCLQCSQENLLYVQTVAFKNMPILGVRRTYIWSQLNPKSKGNLAIKSKSSEIIKSLNPSGHKRQINTNWQLYRMANTFHNLITGSGEVQRPTCGKSRSNCN